MILVVGATGTTGRRVVRALLQRGAAVRAFVRDPARARALLDADVECVAGDLTRPETLDPALDGIERMFLLTPPHPEQVELQGHAVDRARRAGVQHLVKLSVLGAATDSPIALARWHAVTEQQIEESGMAWTHLRPHYFMQNTLAFRPQIEATGGFEMPLRDGRIGMIDAEDIAAVAATVLTEDGHAGKVYELTGPEALDFHAVADAWSAVLGRPVRYVDVPPRDAERAMLAAGVPDWLADSLLGLYALFAANHASGVTQVVADLTGRPARDYRTFLLAEVGSPAGS